MRTASEVRERARIMIEYLNGALRAHSGGGRVELGDKVAKVDTDGRVTIHVFAESASFKLRVIPAIAVVSSKTPQPSAAQKWFAHATIDDVVADMLIHFGKEPSWYDLYKTYEGARELRKRLKQKSCFPSLKNFSHTANYYRHGLPHPAKKKPPSNPMSLEEATDLITGMVNSIMSEL
jgi:hypothetical protein